MPEIVLNTERDLSADVFLESLGDRIESIKTIWDNVLNADTPYQELPGLIDATHYLAGGAGVHGYIAVARLCYQLIELLKPCAEQKVALSRDQESRIEKLISALESQKTYYEKEGNFQVSEKSQDSELGQAHGAEQASSSEIYSLVPHPDEERALKVFLDNAGFVFRSFDSLHKLHKAIRTASPLAVVLDLEQAQNDATGYTFFTALSNNEITCPVFGLSGNGDFASRLRATQMGMTHFFVKPVDGFKMVDTIHKTHNHSSEEQARVLLVDDDPETAQFIALHLKMTGLTVEYANDPTRVLDHIARFSPDIIVSDLYMPECSGLELASVIRQHEVYFDIPVVFLSSETGDDVRLTALQLGSDDFLSKSMDLDMVAKAIKSRLDRMKSYSVVKKAMMWTPN